MECEWCDNGKPVNFLDDKGNPEHLISCTPVVNPDGSHTVGIIYPCTKKERQS